MILTAALFVSTTLPCPFAPTRSHCLILVTCSAVDGHKTQAADERQVANSPEQCCNVPESHLKELSMPTLYGAPISPFVRKVMVALAEKGIA